MQKKLTDKIRIYMLFGGTHSKLWATCRSLPIFKDVFKSDESWRTLVQRLVKSELLPDDKKIIKRIVAQ